MRWHVWTVATVIPLLVRFVPLPRLLRLLTPRRPVWAYRGMAAEEIAAMVARRLAHPRVMRRRACLRQGLTLFHFLHLAGLPAELHMAVFPPNLDPRRMHAHCWVSLHGVDLMAGAAQPSAEMARYGPEKGAGVRLRILPKKG